MAGVLNSLFSVYCTLSVTATHDIDPLNVNFHVELLSVRNFERYLLTTFNLIAVCSLETWCSGRDTHFHNKGRSINDVAFEGGGGITLWAEMGKVVF